MTTPLCVLASVLAMTLAGCGGSSRAAKRPATPSPLATVCTAPGRAAIASFLAAAPSSIAARASMSSQAVPQCVYRVAGVRVTALVDTSPQPYFRLERTAVEAQQVFSAVREARLLSRFLVWALMPTGSPTSAR